MNVCYETVLALGIGWLLDLLFGDPSRLPHPVVAMGRWIAFWERRLNRPLPSDGAVDEPRLQRLRRTKGALLVIVSLLLCMVLTWALLRLLAAVPWRVGSLRPALVAGEALLIFFCLAGHSLRREVRLVFEALDRSLDEGRRQVARIVGRDTQQLSPQEVRTAALETLAENLSDGVVAPLFWLCLLGVPGMVTYKLVNTFDSMIGYRTPRYRAFGCWAARVDDVANFLPARLTALLLVSVGWVRSAFSSSRRSLGSLLRFVVRYGPQHASLNSGWPEAALAALLDCRFGGTHAYFGEEVYKPHIGTNPRPLTTADMHVSISLALAAEVVAVVLSLTLTGCLPSLPFLV